MLNEVGTKLVAKPIDENKVLFSYGKIENPPLFKNIGEVVDNRQLIEADVRAINAELMSAYEKRGGTKVRVDSIENSFYALKVEENNNTIGHRFAEIVFNIDEGVEVTAELVAQLKRFCCYEMDRFNNLGRPEAINEMLALRTWAYMAEDKLDSGKNNSGANRSNGHGENGHNRINAAKEKRRKDAETDNVIWMGSGNELKFANNYPVWQELTGELDDVSSAGGIHLIVPGGLDSNADLVYKNGNGKVGALPDDWPVTRQVRMRLLFDEKELTTMNLAVMLGDILAGRTIYENDGSSPSGIIGEYLPVIQNLTDSLVKRGRQEICIEDLPELQKEYEYIIDNLIEPIRRGDLVNARDIVVAGPTGSRISSLMNAILTANLGVFREKFDAEQLVLKHPDNYLPLMEEIIKRYNSPVIIVVPYGENLFIQHMGDGAGPGGVMSANDRKALQEFFGGDGLTERKYFLLMAVKDSDLADVEAMAGVDKCKVNFVIDEVDKRREVVERLWQISGLPRSNETEQMVEQITGLAANCPAQFIERLISLLNNQVKKSGFDGDWDHAVRTSYETAKVVYPLEELRLVSNKYAKKGTSANFGFDV
jgi:hypothetical protein